MTRWTFALAPPLALISALVQVACDPTEKAAGGTSTGPHRTGVMNTQAPNASAAGVDTQTVDVFADAWCEQQNGCERIGEGRVYESFATCTSEMRRAVSADLRSFDCQHGVDPEHTQACQAAIERVSCTHTLVTLPSLGECTKDALCTE